MKFPIVMAHLPSFEGIDIIRKKKKNVIGKFIANELYVVQIYLILKARTPLLRRFGKIFIKLHNVKEVECMNYKILMLKKKKKLPNGNSPCASKILETIYSNLMESINK